MVEDGAQSGNCCGISQPDTLSIDMADLLDCDLFCHCCDSCADEGCDYQGYSCY